MKKILFLSFALLSMLFTGLFSKVTYAFLSDYDSQTNQVHIEHNDSSIEETFPTPSPIKEGTDNSYTKIVSVKNNQSVPCYVRVYVGFSDNHIGDFVNYKDLNTTDWIYISPAENSKLGGYFYYKNILLPGGSTSPLFKGIDVSSSWDSSVYKNGDTFDVIVYEESVQSDTFTGYLDAWDRFLRI